MLQHNTAMQRYAYAQRLTRRREINESDDGLTDECVYIMGKTVNDDDGDGLAYLPNRYVNPLHTDTELSDVAGRPVRQPVRSKIHNLLLLFSSFIFCIPRGCSRAALHVSTVYLERCNLPEWMRIQVYIYTYIYRTFMNAKINDWDFKLGARIERWKKKK